MAIPLAAKSAQDLTFLFCEVLFPNLEANMPLSAPLTPVPASADPSVVGLTILPPWLASQIPSALFHPLPATRILRQ